MHLFFPTPVWISEIENFDIINQSLIKFIYEEKNNDPSGIRRSNIKGWHSKQFDLNHSSLQIFLKTLKPKIEEAILDMGWDTINQIVKITSMWSVVNNQNSFNERHHHGNSALSVAYYVNADENSGDIVFYDPRHAFTFSHPDNSKINDLNGQIKSIKPKSGMLVLFPSYLDHSVNPNNSTKERVVISFNISLIPKKLLK